MWTVHWGGGGLWMMVPLNPVWVQFTWVVELGSWVLGSQHLHCAPPLTLAPPACPAPGGNITIDGTATYHASIDPGPPFLVEIFYTFSWPTWFHSIYPSLPPLTWLWYLPSTRWQVGLYGAPAHKLTLVPFLNPFNTESCTVQSRLGWIEVLENWNETLQFIDVH